MRARELLVSAYLPYLPHYHTAMKLHLPSGLRKSLLACLAAFALPVTLSTGSAFIFGATCTISLATSASAVSGEWVNGANKNENGNVTIGSDETLTIKVVDTAASYGQVFNVQAGGTLVLDNVGELQDPRDWNGSEYRPVPSNAVPLTISKGLTGSGTVYIKGDVYDNCNLNVGPASSKFFEFTRTGHPMVSIQGEDFRGELVLDNAAVSLTGNMQVTGLSMADTLCRDVYDMSPLFDQSLGTTAFATAASYNYIQKDSSVKGDVEFRFLVEGAGSEKTLTGDVFAISVGSETTPTEGLDAGDNQLIIGEGVRFVKTGAGTLILGQQATNSQILDRLTVCDMEIREGRVKVLGHTEVSQDSFLGCLVYTGRLTVKGELDLTMSWGRPSDGTMELNGGKVSMSMENDSGVTSIVTIPNLEVGANGGTLAWSEASEGRMEYNIGNVSSVEGAKGVTLTVEPMNLTNCQVQRLSFNQIVNFDGTIDFQGAASPNINVYIRLGENPNFASDSHSGWVEQHAGYNAVLNMNGKALQVYNFRKMGEGALTVNGDISLIVSGVLYMNYEGGLTYDRFDVDEVSTFVYTSCDVDKMIHLKYEDIMAPQHPIRYLDLTFVDKMSDLTNPDEGVCLGIWTEQTSEEVLASYIERLTAPDSGGSPIARLKDFNESLLDVRYSWKPLTENDSTGRQYLWISVQLNEEAKGNLYWDSKWGLEGVFGPSREQLEGRAANIGNEHDNGASGTTVDSPRGFMFSNDVNTVIYGNQHTAENPGVALRVKYFTMTGEEFDAVGNTLQLAYSSTSKLPSMSGGLWANNPHYLWETGHSSVSGMEADTHTFAFTMNSMSAIRLAAGSTNGAADTATVIGGRLYTQADADDADYDSHKGAWFLENWRSFIALAGAGTHYHLLVGGSSCVGSREGADGSDGSALGGYQGSTHIEVGVWGSDGSWSDGGTVDYIVGGNHVNNSAFTFHGSSYISVVRGDVVGGIVGGSTLTKGAVNDQISVYAFNGSSNIYIYTPLRNTGAAPGISDGTASAGGIAGESHKGAAFTAVVGGNAWIDVPESATTQAMSPIFYGTSNIAVDISADAVMERSFDKDIVGGNFTAFTGTVTGAGDRNTTFEGESNILIKAADSVEFNGMINGASRRASGGAGLTGFTGDTYVRIGGGKYCNVVAGGMAFDAGATGAHSSKLSGHTRVELDSGAFWRVAGGSVTLGGGHGASETHEGNSTVLVRGGTYGTEHMTADNVKTAFVAGGSYYAGNVGGEYSHLTRQDGEAATASVVINATNATTFKGAFIVGGDFVDSDNNAGSGLRTGIANTAVSITEGEGTLQINGNVVGGSYTGQTSAHNTLSVANAGVTINSGTIVGNVYGGHYSENTVAPDELNLDKATVTMKGGRVTGNIVGGSYRATGSDTLGSYTTQGDITVDLQGGVLDGNVYAAGWNASSAGTAATRTSSTRVVIGESFRMEGSGHVISGGYGRAGLAIPGLVDKATLDVQVDNPNFAGSGVSFTDAVKQGILTLTRFNEINVGGDITLELPGKLAVVRATQEQFIKSGDGVLSVEDLVIYYGNETEESVFSGRLVMNAGTLRLAKAHDISSGLSFNLSSLASHSRLTDVYLDATGGLLLKGTAELELLGSADDLRDAAYGTYYLATGLGEDITADENFKYDISKLSQALEESNRYLELRVIDGNLVLQVRDTADRGVFHWGGTSAAWKDDSRDGWDESLLGEPNTPSGHNVYFNAVGQGSGVVEIDGSVAPRSIWVQSGEFTFTGGEGAALNVGGARKNAEDYGSEGQLLDHQLGVSELAVGGEGSDAHLTLKVSAKRLDHVLLKDRGTLTLDAADAILTGNTGTSIGFQGGVLEYGSAFSADVSRQVSTNSTGRVRVSVADAKSSVTWGGSGVSSETNPGVQLALSAGMDKLGKGTFTMEWLAPVSSVVDGRIRVSAGELVYRVHAGGSGSLPGITLTKGAEIAVQGGATLTLEMAEGGSMHIERAFTRVGDTPAGTVQLRKVAGKSSGFAPFYINADNSMFDGTIALVGNSSVGMSDVVQVAREMMKPAVALGGQYTTLTLAGLSIMLPADDTNAPYYTQPTQDDDPETFVSERIADIHVRRINVAENTVNYIGGTAQMPGGNADLYVKSSELLGSGVLANAAGTGTFAYRHTYEGSLSAFAGTIVAGDARTSQNPSASSSSSWELVDAGGGDLLANFAGNGTIIFNFESARATRLLGRIGDETAGSTTSLENVGLSELVIIGDANKPNIATGSIITHSGRKVGNIRLGDNEAEGVWAGRSLRGDGTLVLTNGKLVNGIAGKEAEATLLVETVVRDSNNPNESTSVDVGGTDASLIDRITVTAGGHVTGLGGDVNIGEGKTAAGRPINGLSASLTFGKLNIADAPTPDAPANYLLATKGGNVIVNDPSQLRLDFTNDAFADVLDSMTSNSGGVAWLHVVTGGKLQIEESLYEHLLAVSRDSENGMAALLSVLGFTVDGVNGGDLGIAGKASMAYIVKRNEGDPGDEGNDPTVPPVGSDGHGYGILSAYTSIIVTEGKTLTINLTDKPQNETGEVSTDALARDIAAGGALVNNLVGMSGSQLVVNNGKLLELGEDETLDLTHAANRVSIVLHNSESWDALAGSEKEQMAAGIDTSFEGTITAGAGVDMVKSGRGTLSIGAANGSGGLKLAEGDMRIIAGGLALRGAENTLRSLTFAYEAPVNEDIFENRTVTLHGGLTKLGSLVEDGTSDVRRGGDIVLEQGAELLLTGASFISDTVIRQGDGDTGTLTIDTQGVLTLGALLENELMPRENQGSSAMPDQLRDIRLHVKSGGVLDMALSQGSVTNLSGGGTLTGSGGTLSISGAENGVFSGEMKNVGALKVQSGARLTFRDAVGGSAWAVDNYGELIVDLSNSAGDLALGEVTLRSGSTTSIHINTDKGEQMSVINAALFDAERGSKVEVYSTGDEIITGDEVVLAHVSAVPSRSRVQNAQVGLHGVSFLHFKKDASLYVRDNDLVLGLQVSDHNEFITPGMHKNALAGANLFWDATDAATNPEWESIAKDKESDLYKMAVALDTMRAENRTADLHRTLAAGAGASASVLGSVVAKDVERQLRSIRNRTTTMGSELRFDGNNALPLYHMWINGESNYHKLSSDGLAPGFTLNSWGGTVGMDADVSANTTVGLAVSAMYGDLKTHSADAAHGDTTTTYLSGFARHASGAWTHTFVVTAGFADVKLDRTVNYGTGHYITRGHTNGYQLGALYEVGYARALNVKGSAVLQGVANVELRYAELGGYSELNTEAGLRVDDISYSAVTFGVGARLQAVVAENALNRASIFEARALVKADAGDRSGKATTSLIHGAATRQEVESAEVGVLGFEIGAGLTVPVRGKGACFVDASAELRSGYTEVNANVGYRMSF